MFRKIAAIILFLTIAAGLAYAGKTVFNDGTPSQGIKGTRVTAEFLNKTSYNVPTGEDLEGSAPLLYGADIGVADAYVVNLTQGKKRATGTNTSTSANKLIDSGAAFQTASVQVGDVVLNVTDKTSATVSTIDSQTQLTLSSNIFTATGKTYAVGPNIQQLPQAYTTGAVYFFKAVNASTGASTVNINSLGVKTIKKNGGADLIGGDIAAGQITGVSYDGTYMQLMSQPGYTFLDSGGRLLWSKMPSWRGAHVKNSNGGLSQNVNSTLAPASFDTALEDTDSIHESNSKAFTVTIASPAVFTATAHGFVAKDPIWLTTTGALPTGLSTGVIYYVISTGLTANTFRVSLNPEGTAVNTSVSQSGTHTVHRGSRLVVPAGVTRVRLWGMANIQGKSTAATDVSLRFYKNGTGGDGFASMLRDVSSIPNPVVTPVLSVTAGDYFELMLKCTGGTGISFGGLQAQMEIVE